MLRWRIETAVDRENLYLPLPGRTLALRLRDGLPAWPSGQADDQGQLEWNEHPGASGLAVARRAGEMLIVARIQSPSDSGDSIAAFDVGRAEGRLLWNQDAAGELRTRGWRITGAPVVTQNQVYVPVTEQASRGLVGVAELDAAMGNVRRLFSVPRSGEVRSGTMTAVVVTPAHVLVNVSGSQLWAADRQTGRVDWTVQTARQLSPDEKQNPKFLAAGGLIHSIEDRLVMTRDLVSGQAVWSFEVDHAGARLLTTNGDQLLVEDGRIFALGRTTGELIWRYDARPSRGESLISIGDGVVAVERTGQLSLLDGMTGAVLDQGPISQSEIGTVIAINITPEALIIVTETTVAILDRWA